MKYRRPDKHPSDATLGRFRISVTTARRPIGLGLPDDLRAILSRERRGDEDPERALPLLKYVRAVDPEHQRLAAALAEAKKPPPADDKLAELRARVQLASAPPPEDPQLAQLRADLEASTKQLRSRRLTVAQDVAWALINSPAFLFNR